MDIGEIEARLPTVSEINEQFVETTKDYVKQKLTEVLMMIAHKEQTLSREELMKYLDMVDFEDINMTVVHARRSRRKISSEDQCCALTSKKVRCTRKRKEGMFCGSHTNARPYGEIEEHHTELEHDDTKIETETSNPVSESKAIIADKQYTGAIQTKQSIKAVPQTRKTVPVVKLRVHSDV